MRKLGEGLVTCVMSIAVAVAVLTITFSLLLTPWPTHVFAQMFSDEGPSGLTHAQMVSVADGILDYSLGNDDAAIPRGTDYVTALDANALNHLLDCRPLFNGIRAMAVTSGFITLVLIIILAIMKKRVTIGRSLKGAALVVGLLLISCAGYAVLDFYSFFNFLHTFFFPSGTWIFPADCLMICALPLPFWAAMAILWAILILVALLLCVKIGRKCSRC